MNGNIGENIFIPAADRRMYEGYFAQLRSKNGHYVDSTTAKEFFSKSMLPKNILVDMWNKADRSKDGRLDVEEFCIAMHILRTALHGQKNERSASSPNIHGLNGAKNISGLAPSQNGSRTAIVKAAEESCRSGSETTWDFSKFATTLPKAFADFQTMVVFPEPQKLSPSLAPLSTLMSKSDQKTKLQRRSKLSDFVVRKRLDLIEHKREVEALRKEFRDLTAEVKKDKDKLESLQTSITHKDDLKRRLENMGEETRRQEIVLKSSNILLEKEVRSVKASIEHEKLNQHSFANSDSIPKFSTAERKALDLSLREAAKKTAQTVAGYRRMEEDITTAKRNDRVRSEKIQQKIDYFQFHVKENRGLVEQFRFKQRRVLELQRLSWCSVETEGSSDHSSKKDEVDVGSLREETAKEVEYGIALYPYEARNSDELSFNADDYIEILPSHDADMDWLFGRVFGGDGTVGYVPANYLQFEKNDEFFDEDFVDRSAIPSNAPDENSSLRRKAISELVDTEEKYLADMRTVMEVFHEDVRKSGSCNEAELNEIFTVWNPLIISSGNLCQIFRNYGSEVFEVIGSVLQKSLPDPSGYVSFCCNQVKICELIREKTNDNPQFAEVIRQCSQNSRLQGLPLTAAYVKPMQRITRYPLLIKRIMEATTPSFPDYPYLQAAFVRAETLCQSVNERVRDCENGDRFEWLQRHVALDSYSDKIRLTSQTNHMGNRVLLYQGSLYKVKGGRELIAFLFNDFLLLTTPPKQLTSSLGNFSFDRRRWTQTSPFRIYKKPLLLNGCSISQLPDSSSFLLTFPPPLSGTLPLKATTIQEGKAWIRKLEEAVKEHQKWLPSNHRKLTRTGHSSHQPTGVCRVVIQEASELSLKGEKGKFDVFCKVGLAEDEEQSTKVVDNTEKPRWEHHMNLYIHNLGSDVLSVTVMQYNAFAPNEFLGRAEVRLAEVFEECRGLNVPLVKRLLLQGVESGEVLVKIAIQML